MEWPGLAEETTQICRSLGIEDCNFTTNNKIDYKESVTKACHRMNKLKLLALAEGKIKCERMKTENYGKKEYINKKLISEVRKWYKSRYGMLPFAGNFSNDNKFAKTDWMCRCGVKEKENHLTSYSCPVYSDIRQKYTNFDADEDLVSYFQEVLDRRDLIDRLEAEERDFEEE